MLLSRDGRRYIVPEGTGLVRVNGLGIVDRTHLSASDFGRNVSVAGKSFTLLPPTLDDFLNGISRGPQIITAKDAAQIVQSLGIHSGSCVVEGGAGSGSLTVALLNAVHPEFKQCSVRCGQWRVRTGCTLYRNMKLLSCMPDTLAVRPHYPPACLRWKLQSCLRRPCQFHSLRMSRM